MRRGANAGCGWVILFGYAVVAIGEAENFYQERTRITPGILTYDVATVLSYALLGLAWWSYIAVLRSTPNVSTKMRWPLWLFALSSAVLALGYFAVARLIFNVKHHNIPNVAHSAAQVAGLGICVAGLIVVTLGFVWAGQTSGSTARAEQEVTSAR
jgi:hypothetical protein